MTRRYHPTHAEVCFQRQRSGPLSVANGGSQTYAIANLPSLDMDQGDIDNGKGSNRKRIAVACSRCRKRKIKCSGDQGDGRGCVACRNSGSNPGACQFLRVNSQDVGGLYDPCNSNLVALYGSGAEFGCYGPNIPMQSQSYPTSRNPRHYASNVHTSQLPFLPDSFPRQTETTLDSSISYSSAGPSNYNSYYQANLYCQPDTNVYYSSTGTTAHRSGPVVYDNHGFSSTNPVVGSQLSSASPPSLPSEAHSSFSSMDTLAHSLPGSAQRTLPTPRSSAGNLIAAGDECTEPVLPLQQPILKSHRVDFQDSSFSIPSLLPPSGRNGDNSSDATRGVTSPDSSGSQKARSQKSASLSSGGSFSGYSAYTPQQASPSGEEMISMSTATQELGVPMGTAASEQGFGSMLYRHSFAMDPQQQTHQGGNSASRSKASGVQYPGFGAGCGSVIDHTGDSVASRTGSFASR